MPTDAKESDMAKVSAPEEGHAETSPDSKADVSADQLAQLLQSIPPIEEGGEAEPELEGEETPKSEEEIKKEKSAFELLQEELGFKDQDAFAQNYKEMQSRASKVDEDNKFLKGLVEKKGEPQPIAPIKQMTREEFNEMVSEDPLKALDLHFANRTQGLQQELQTIRTEFYIQSVQEKNPDFDIHANESQIVEIYKKHPGLYSDPTGLELVIELLKKKATEKKEEEQLEEARRLGQEDAEETLREKERAGGVVSRRTPKSFPDVSKMSAKEIEQLLPKAE